MRRIVTVLGALTLLLGASACGRRRTEEVVQVDVSQGGATSGGQTVYVVGAPAQGAPAAPDYVSQHMNVRYSQFAPDMVPDTPLYHGYLQQGQEESFQTVLEAGRCYRLIGVGGPTMSDLDLFIVDENGNPIAQDTATDNFPVLGVGQETICPRWTGPFFVRALAYSGYGEYGLQLFRTP
ncbi:hypothetical protein [Sandaracinus amylolyticus]|uniref:hypothetical protein n=1 Tax=Sandaracinus amylolyticus TaxID=927083 RepID=UPI001F26BB3E|nr:hypothetical protein [Sandaracinus amylolyticus]UJR80883.1 Hypothetical protein I5071_29330 [Sandaracinus amylolyticus]